MTDDVEAQAVAVLSEGGLRLPECYTASGDVLLSRLRELAPRFDPMSSLGLRIRARLAGEQDYRSGRSAAILAVLGDATRAGDPVARALALSLAHHCLLAPGGPERAKVRRMLTNELIGESVNGGLRGELLMGLLRQTVNLFIDGDRHAERRLRELKEALGHDRDAEVANAVGAIEVLLSIRAGNLDLAEAQARDCLERGAAIGDVEAPGVHFVQTCAIRWYQGRISQVWPVLAGLTALPPGRDLPDQPRSSTWLARMYCVVEEASLRGDAETCARAYKLLGPYAGQPIIAGLGVLCLGSVRHPLGVAALTAGHLDQAVRHLRVAVDDNLALRHWPAVVLSRFRYGQALLRRGQPDDLSIAHKVLVTARQDAGALGLPVPGYADEKQRRQAAAKCARIGRQWRIQYGRRSVFVPDSVGMAHLAVLVAGPGRQVPAVELAARLDVLRAAAAGAGSAARDHAREHERARLAVSKAIRRTIAAIARIDAQLGAHFVDSVVTGARCSYRPY